MCLLEMHVLHVTDDQAFSQFGKKQQANLDIEKTKA